jgi:hypothetical protein
VNREPNLNDLIGTDVTGAERQRLQHVHELLLEAGPPPEISAELEAGPTLGMTLSRKRRKPRAMLLLAAALALGLVFFAGYSVRSNKNGNGSGHKQQVMAVALEGTPLAPDAQGTIQVWDAPDNNGNWPMTLRAVGLPKLPPHNYYEVYLLRNGKPWGSCGTFRVGGTGSSDQEVTVTLTAPYSLHKGDKWVVTRAAAGGAEPGRTVLRPVTA